MVRGVHHLRRRRAGGGHHVSWARDNSRSIFECASDYAIRRMDSHCELMSASAHRPKDALSYPEGVEIHSSVALTLIRVCRRSLVPHPTTEPVNGPGSL